MFRNLNGIRTLNRMPECLVIIDPNKEKNAIKEARTLGITTLSLIDTDCDPDLVDLKRLLRERLAGKNVVDFAPGGFAKLCHDVEGALRLVIEQESNRREPPARVRSFARSRRRRQAVRRARTALQGASRWLPAHPEVRLPSG